MKKASIVKALITALGITFICMARSNVFAATNPIAFRVGAHSFILPFQKVSGTELYSFQDEKGFPGLETVLYSYQKFQVSFGAAAVLGSSKDVPFIGAQFRLPSSLFDVSNNDLLFGAFLGKESGHKGLILGLKASTKLW